MMSLLFRAAMAGISHAAVILAVIVGFSSVAGAQTVRPRPVPRPIPVPVPVPSDSGAPSSDPSLTPATSAAKKPTTILADLMQMDMSKKDSNTGIFSGNVKVTGTDLAMTCKELRVSLGADNKVQKIVAVGNVDIVQPRRRTQAAQADYDMSTGIIVLTGSPEVTEPKSNIKGSTIKIDRDKDTIEVEKPTVVMADGVDALSSPKDANDPPDALPGAPAAPKTPTTVVADHMFMDRKKNIGIFHGAVRLTGQDLTMTCKEMHVAFNKANKPEKVIALVDVDVNQPKRRIQSGQADYDLVTKVIVLTVRPEVIEPKTTVRGDIITIEQNRNTLEVKNSTVVLEEGVDTNAKERNTASTAPTPQPERQSRPR